MEQQSLYNIIGKDKLYTIIENFYIKVYDSKIISHLFVGDRKDIEHKQKLFLTQFFGGPSLYTDTYGHPRMRMRHLPFTIDNAAKEEWLKLMKESIFEQIEDEELAQIMYERFPKVAQHMRNS